MNNAKEVRFDDHEGLSYQIRSGHTTCMEQDGNPSNGVRMEQMKRRGRDWEVMLINKESRIMKEIFI